MKRQFLFTICVILALVFGSANVSPARAATTYTLIDLGAVGDSTSYPYAINEAGQVIGESYQAGAFQHAFVWENGMMTDLSLGGSYSHASDFNEAGQVVGFSELANGSEHAFLWDNGVMTDLTLDVRKSYAYAINEAGQIIGSSLLANGYHDFVWENGVMTYLGTLGGSYSGAVAINESGQVVGRSALPGNTSEHAFVWENRVMTDLGTLGGSYSGAVAINEAGQVIGYSDIAGDAERHAFVWENGVMTDLGTLGSSNSSALAINEAGQVIGYFELANGSEHAFVWENGVMTDLTLGGSNSSAYAINEAGQVVGFSDIAGDAERHAFVWENGVMTDLGTFGGSHSYAYDINEAGQVAGYAYLANGSSHAFVWENGVMTDLGTLGGSDSFALAINEAGQVAGSSSLVHGYHAFVATPATNQNQPPTTSVGGTYSVNEGASVTVSASGTDPEGGPLTFAWDLDNNGTFETSGQSVTFSAAALDGPSTHTIKVQVTDNGGLTAIDQTTVNVLNVPPTANLTISPEAILEGEAATLSFSNQFDPSVPDTAAGFLYSYDCTNNGSFELADSPLASYACTYPTAGTFTARGRIADKDGGFTDYLVKLDVSVDHLPPVGTVDNMSVVVDEGEIALNGGQYLDENPEHDVTITASVGAIDKTGTSIGDWSWSFQTTDGAEESQPVTLTFDDGQGTALVMEFALTVNNVVPEVYVDANLTIAEGETFSGTGSFTDPGNDSWTGTVDYGDGSGDQPLSLRPDKTFDLSHFYTTPGEFDANITISDDDGGISSLSFTVTVRRLKIAFISRRDDNYEIYVMNTDGSDQTRVTNTPAFESDLTWSPDGTRLAFISGRDGNSEIYVMNADGSNQLRLTYDPAKDYYPSWSPDGTQIAFITDRPGAPELRVVNTDGSNLRVLADRAWYWGYPAWSPDGMQVAFSSHRDGNLEIYLVNADGSNSSNPTRLTENPSDELDPAWSPDGMQIAVSSYRDWDVTFNIAMINVDGTGMIYLTNNWEDVEPFWSPEGTRIAFTSWRDDNEEIYVMNPDGTGQTRLTNHPAGSANPNWSPNGKRIAFNSLRDGNNEIYVMNADGTGQTRLTNNPKTDWYPVWQPLPRTPDNTPPVPTVDNISAEVDEGETASNGGTYFDLDPEDDVVITASVGTISQTGTNSGTWSWSLPTIDGPAESQTVAITYDDGRESFPSVGKFPLIVNNVAPMADLTISSQAIQEGESATLSFSNPFDPSAADTAAGLLYSYDCTNDGVFELADVSLASYDCAYPEAGTFTALGRITDKDGGFTDYVIEIQVLLENLPPIWTMDNVSVMVDEGEIALNTGTYFDDPEDDVVITASVGTITKTGTSDGEWFWSFQTTDGPGEIQSVTISLSDGHHPFPFEGDFALFVKNVAPIATFSRAPSALLVEQSATLAFSNPFDPSVVDTAAGFLYSYDCTNDGLFELADSALVSYACAYPEAGTFSAFGRIADKDGGFTDYTVTITVLTPQEGIQGLIEQVQSLIDQGVLNGGQGNALIAKLQAAIQQLDRGNVATALNQLESFINAVNADIRSGKLTVEEGQPLLDAADAIIAALGG